MKRMSITKKATVKDLYEMVYKSLELIDYGFSLFSDRSCKDELRSSRSLSIESKLKHGDVLYFKQMAGSSVRIIIKKFEKMSNQV
jgi:hypothetical protein